MHKLGGLQQRLARCGVEVLFLPPYSPDFPRSSRAGASSKRNCAKRKPAPARRC
ncbi:hypothetical protein [Hymenobacter guriensis]|uniref:hypothetical protein n=1 Tax=Hymenobacter guriensis TaxID=2793065 RepID=UPI003743829D